MSEYTYVQLNEHNLGQLYKLHKSVYGKKVAKNYYHLKYNTDYTGVKFIGFFAFLGQKPVAFFSLIPVFVSINGQKVLAAQSCDAMTDHRHRKKGLFVNLAGKTFEVAKEKGIHFIFGFPNQDSYPILVQKLGFSDNGTMQRYTFNFKDNLYKKIIRRVVKIKKSKSQTIFLNSLLRSGFDGIIYDCDYMNYKKYNRSRLISTKEYSAWISYSGSAWLGAISDLSQNNVNHLIDKIKNKYHCGSFTFMISPGVPLPDIFEDIKREEGFAVITKNFSGKYNLSNLKFQFADADIF